MWRFVRLITFHVTWTFQRFSWWPWPLEVNRMTYWHIDTYWQGLIVYEVWLKSNAFCENRQLKVLWSTHNLSHSSLELELTINTCWTVQVTTICFGILVDRLLYSITDNIRVTQWHKLVSHVCHKTLDAKTAKSDEKDKVRKLRKPYDVTFWTLNNFPRDTKFRTLFTHPLTTIGLWSSYETTSLYSLWFSRYRF